MSERKHHSPTRRATLPAINAWQVYKRLLGYVRPLWFAFLVAILANAVYSGLDTLFVKSLAPLVDKGLIGKDVGFLGKAPLFVIALIATRGIANFVADYAMAWVGRKVVMQLRQELFARLLQLPVGFFDRNNSGELLSKITFNTEQVARASTDAVTTAIKEGAFAIGLLYVMFSENWRLAATFVIAAPFIAVMVRYTTLRFRKVSRQIQDSMGDITHVAQESLEGYKVVKTYGGFDFENERFDKVSNRNRQQQMKLIATKAMSVPVVQFIAALAFALTIYVSTQEIMAGRLSAGSFVALMSAIMALLKPLKDLTTVNSTMQQGVAAAHSIFEILDMAPEPDTGTRVLERARGEIEYRNVDFGYGDEQVLKNISFTVKPGQKVALVGRSGSGKSTITSLLMRFYQPQSGEILIDGVPVQELTLASLRSQIAVVSQQVTLFNDTVAHNIAYGGLQDVSSERLVAAAKTAHAWDFIQGLAQGMDTVVGENGSLLSGGQRQRIAIARAVLKNAPILILDEATSALDTESERHIQAALESLMEGCTSLVIAHRLSTIENADQILVVDAGRIVEAGTHGELLARGGEYARLHAMQFRDAATA